MALPTPLPRSLAGRLILILGLILALGDAGAVYKGWLDDQALLVAEAQQGNRHVAALVARDIDGDAHQRMAADHPAQDEITDWGTAPVEVQQARSRLVHLAQAAELASPTYTMVLRSTHADAVNAAPGRSHPDAMAFVLSSAEAPYWRHTYEWRPEMAEAWFSQTATTTARYEDARGAWVSAYAPVLDGQGRTVALLCVDTPLDALIARSADLAQQRAAGSVLRLGLLFGVLGLVVRRMTRGLRRVEQAARRLGQGDFSVPFRSDGSVELGHLALALEEARAGLGVRMGELQAMRGDLEHRLALAERGVTPEVQQRRARIQGMGDSLSTAIRVDAGGECPATLMDLTQARAMVRLPIPGLDFAPGVPVRLVLAHGPRPPVRVRCLVESRREDALGRSFQLAVLEPRQLDALDPDLRRLANLRSALRVAPHPSRPVRCQLRLADGRVFPAGVVDLSVSGCGLRVDAAVPEVARWGTQILVALRLPQPIMDLTLVATLRNVDGRLGDTRLGVSFETRTPDFERQQRFLHQYIQDRDRERDHQGLSAAG